MYPQAVCFWIKRIPPAAQHMWGNLFLSTFSSHSIVFFWSERSLCVFLASRYLFKMIFAKSTKQSHCFCCDKSGYWTKIYAKINHIGTINLQVFTLCLLVYSRFLVCLGWLAFRSALTEMEAGIAWVFGISAMCLGIERVVS